MKILIIDDGRGLGREVALALNSQAQDSVGIALNFELAVGEPPTEMMLIPPGENVQGRDGRAWKNTAPQGIVDYFTVRGVDLPIDVEHATELKAPQGEPAPAAAWIKGLEVREGGAIYGRIEWTPGGRDMVLNREYRYYSPVLIYEKESGIIRGLSSVGLTNKPNLTVTALNHEQTKEKHMNLVALLAALGLPATHTFDQALNHITTLRSDYATALNRAETPDLAKFVPRAQFDAAVAKANNAEKGLKELKTAETEKAINSEIDAALKAGKIVPATKEFYIGMCRQEGGLESFRQFVAAAPVIAGDTDLDNAPPATTGKALNAAQKEVCAAMGMAEDDYLKAL